MLNRCLLLSAFLLAMTVTAQTNASDPPNVTINIKNADKRFMIAVIVNAPDKLISMSNIPPDDFTKHGGKFVHPGDNVNFSVPTDSDYVIYAAIVSRGDIIEFSGTKSKQSDHHDANYQVSVPGTTGKVKIDFLR